TNIDLTDDSESEFNQGTHSNTIYQNGYLTLKDENNLNIATTNIPRNTYLIGHWKLDETGWNGTAEEVKDSSGNGHHGTAVGNAKISNYPRVGTGKGVFDGNGDYINLGSDSAFDLTTAVAASMWVKSYGAHQGGHLINRGGGWSEHGYSLLWDQNSIRVEVQNGTKKEICNTGLEDFNRWIHVGFTWKLGDGNIKIYVNGVRRITCNTTITDLGTQNQDLYIGGNATHPGFEFKGEIDDVMLWRDNAPVADVYNLQKTYITHSGTFTSRIMDNISNTSALKSAAWETPFPYLKEIPKLGESYSSSDYSELTTDNLTTDLVALYHFNEVSPANATTSILDSSGNNHHAIPQSSPSFNTSAVLKSGVTFNGTNDIKINKTGDFPIFQHNSFSISFWTKGTTQWDKKIYTEAGHWSTNEVSLISTNNEQIRFYTRDAASPYVTQALVSNAKVFDGDWHHVTFVNNNGVYSFYIDGVKDSSLTKTTGTQNFIELNIGSEKGGGKFTGSLDEMAFWKRALSNEEITRLFRLGSQKVTYQFRTCTQSNCSDQEALTNKGWIGPGGNHNTKFSEVYTNTQINFSCATSGACTESEISLTGDVSTGGANLNFDNFQGNGLGSNSANRYFQYKIEMEAKSFESFCSNMTVTCLPKIKSISINP
ncbi:unnamed protein product, partial [Chrysoparadoxa australica]